MDITEDFEIILDIREGIMVHLTLKSIT